jgi:hypothetical protein
VKSLALMVMALGLWGAAYAGEIPQNSGFSLAIQSEADMTVQRPGAAEISRAFLIRNKEGPRILLYPGEFGGAPLGGFRPDREIEGNALKGGALSLIRQQPETNNPSLAEVYMERLAKKTKTNRMLGGALALGIGGVGVGVGITLASGDPDTFPGALGRVFGTATIIAGGLAVGAGTYALAVPGAEEKEYRDVRAMTDPAQRETASRLALPRLAARGRRNRIITGVIFSAISVLSFASSSGDDASSALFSGALWGGLAAYSFLVKSPAERASRDYLEESEARKSPQFFLGVGPHGRIQAGFAMSY